MQIKNKKGFTLVELMTVIAMIGILSGVVIVSTMSSRDKAMMNQALSTMSTLLPTFERCSVNSTGLNQPSSTASPSETICVGGTEKYPSLDGTKFIYCGSGCGGWTAIKSDQYAFSAYSDSFSGGRKVIVCGSNIDQTGWFGVGSWNFAGATPQCKTYGF